MSAWRRHQFVTSTQTARTRLAPTFVLVKRVLLVTVTPVKVKWWAKHWLNEDVSDKYYIFITWNGLLSLQEQRYHLIVLCFGVFNKWTIIGASGISFTAGYTQNGTKWEHAWKFWPKIRPTFRGRAEDWVHVNQKKNGGSKGTWPSGSY